MDQQSNHEEDNATVKENIESLFESVKDYSKTNLDLFKLKAADRSAEIIYSAIAAVVVGVVATIFFAILSVGVALLLGEWLGKTYYGFFVLSGFYLIAGIILYAFRKKIFKEPITNSLLKKLFK